MECWICVTCGTQFAPAAKEPDRCPICDDERQYVPPAGQSWVTPAELRAAHKGEIRELEPDLFGVGAAPSIAIGQRALLVRTPAGNLLWDCIPLLDDATEHRVRELGGLAAIAISHPHFYTSMIEWSHAFGRVPVHLPAADRQWVMRPDPVIDFWEGDTRRILPGLTMIRCGGHFPGSSVLHWERGALFTGDTIMVVPDRKHVSFMYSYPNLVPLPYAEVRRIVDAVRPYAYDRIYGGWWDRVIARGAKAAVEASAERYIAHR